MTTERPLPHSLDAERAVLGAVLVNPDAYFAVRQLRPEEFFRDAHTRIWRAIGRLVARNAAVDFLTLREELDVTQDLETAGGPIYLAGLIDGVPRSVNIEAYAAIVRRKARRRAIIQVARKMLLEALDEEDETADVLDSAQRALLSLTEQTDRRGLVPAEALVQDVQPLLERILNHEAPVTGVATGFRELDAMTRGLRAGELILLAGRPSMGKSSLAGNIAEHVSDRGEPVAWYSLEMTRDDVTLRQLASVARLDFHALLSGHLPGRSYSDLAAGISRVAAFALHVADEAETTLLDIRATARRLKTQADGLALVIVDYLQLVRTPAGENRNLEIAALSRGLKGLAKELSVPVLALSQLSRDTERRADKRPLLADLRDSGALEQDADAVWFIHRPEVYGVTDENRGKAELIIAKARNGPTGTVPLVWLGHQMRFVDADWDARDEPSGQRMF